VIQFRYLHYTEDTLLSRGELLNERLAVIAFGIVDGIVLEKASSFWVITLSFFLLLIRMRL
jgi:hypothetical protein